jgi:hypothetical protein
VYFVMFPPNFRTFQIAGGMPRARAGAVFAEHFRQEKLMFTTPDPDIPQGPQPGDPRSPEQPVVPPDDPNRPDVDREPSIDPPPTEPPMRAPSEKPISEPPAPRA